MAKRHQRLPVWVAIGLLTAVLTGSLAFVAGQTLSPQQKAAMADPPPRTIPTARVELRAVIEQQVGRAEVVYPGAKPVKLVAGDDGDVVTHRWVKAGQRVRAGSVLVEVAGHPVVAVPAPFSPYRDLTVGDDGRDVAVLRAGMRKFGVRTRLSGALTANELHSLNSYLNTWGYTLPQTSDCDVKSDANSDANNRGSCEKPRPSLPRSWWVGVKTVPAVVADPGPSVGSQITGKAAIKLSSGALMLRVSMALSDAAISPGQAVVFDEDGGESVPWEVASAVSESNSESKQSVYLIQPTHPISSDLLGAAGKVTIDNGEHGEHLAVPLTALTVAADGVTPAVRVMTTDGSTTVITVRVGTQANGWAAVEATNGTLSAGMEVALG